MISPGSLASFLVTVWILATIYIVCRAVLRMIREQRRRRLGSEKMTSTIPDRALRTLAATLEESRAWMLVVLQAADLELQHAQHRREVCERQVNRVTQALEDVLADLDNRERATSAERASDRGEFPCIVET